MWKRRKIIRQLKRIGIDLVTLVLAIILVYYFIQAGAYWNYLISK